MKHLLKGFKQLTLLAVVLIGIGILRVPILRAVTASYNETVQIVDSAGNVIGGTASAVIASYNQTVRVVDSTGHVLDGIGAAGTTGPTGPTGPSGPAGTTGPSGPALTGSQYQVATFTATNVASGNSHIVTDSTNDLFITAGGLAINSVSTPNAFSLSQRDGNNDLGIAVATFRSLNPNAVTALDVSPNGTATDTGYGAAWNDVCNADILNGGTGNFTCAHMGARSSGEVDFGENQYGSGSVGPVVIVGGSGSGSSATKIASFSATTGETLGSALALRLTPVNIGSLPSCSSTVAGALETINDSDLACVFNTAPTHATCTVGTNCYTCQVQCAEAGSTSYAWIAY